MELDEAILDNLMPDLVGHDRHPAAFLVFLYFWRRTRDFPSQQIALREITDGTGLSKRSVQTAIRRLERRRLVSVTRKSVTAVPAYTLHWPWTSNQTEPEDRGAIHS